MSGESIFVITIIILLFILTAVFTLPRQREIAVTGNFIKLKSECDKMSNAVNYLFINGEGSSYSLDTDYVINAYNNTIYLKKVKNETADIYCKSELNIASSYNLTGKIEFVNINNTIIMRNYA